MSTSLRLPQTHYAQSGDVSIAYQVIGDGPLDIVYVPGWVSHVEYAWEDPALAHFYQRLASFSRLIRFDKRGTGLSDRVADLPTLEMRMDDVRAVMDAVGSERAALCATSEGGPMCMVFSATYPDRAVALVTIGTFARRIWAPDYPWAPTSEERELFFRAVKDGWGGTVDLDTLAPTAAHDPQVRQWWATYLRLGASPGAALQLAKMNTEVDVRHVLPTIRVPTLILQRRGDRDVKAEQATYIADRIPNAKLVMLEGDDHLPWYGDAEAILDEIEEFLTGVRHGPQTERVLATVLFTDIVGSTELAAKLGDRKWHELLENHHRPVRRELNRFRGQEVDTAGDGFLATFDGPARAIRCASAVADAVSGLGIEVRAGLHTGECEFSNGRVQGLAVHVGARVAALADGGEVLVSSTVKDLVAGSGISFQDHGLRALKGVPDEWRIFRVESV